jgi:hypothetical protein
MLLHHRKKRVEFFQSLKQKQACRLCRCHLSSGGSDKCVGVGLHSVRPGLYLQFLQKVLHTSALLIGRYST